MENNKEKIYPSRSGDFEKKLRSLFSDLKENDPKFESSLNADSASLRDIICRLLGYGERSDKLVKFKKDFKVLDVDTENLEFDNVSKTDNGIEYAILFVGGDWEHPVDYVVYFDKDENLRCYLPKSGNLFNSDTMSALGNDTADDARFLLKSHPYLLESSNLEDRYEYENKISTADEINAEDLKGLDSNGWYSLIDDISNGYFKLDPEAFKLIPSEELEDFEARWEDSDFPDDELYAIGFERACEI